MHEAFVLLACSGLAYGAVAIFSFGSGYAPKAREARSQRTCRGNGVYAALYWFVTLPVEAPALALCLAALMALPALVF
jgi:hypothetical protein